MKNLNFCQKNRSSLIRNVNFKKKLTTLFSVTASSLLVPALASALDLQTSANTTLQYFGHSQKIDEQITITNNTDISGFKVLLTNPQIGDELIFLNQNGITGSFDNSSNDLFVLTLSGEASTQDYQSALRSVSLNTTQISGNREIIFAIDLAGEQVLFNTDNYHYYRYSDVPASEPEDAISWLDAYTSANSQTLLGLQGYLVTVTSEFENTLITSNTNGLVWMGGSDDPTLTNQGISDWYWVTGPEAGTLFWDSSNAPNGAPNGVFTNWNTNEPNDYNNTEEFYLHFYGQDQTNKASKWNDLSTSVNNSHKITGYMVEFGDMPSDTTQLVASKLVSVSQNDAPTITVTITNSLIENSASANQEVASYTVSDAQDLTPSVDFFGNNNAPVYFNLSNGSITLTQAGADYVNAGNTLPSITLIATDSLGANNQSSPKSVTIQSENDSPVITLTLSASINELTASLHQEVATFTSSDEEDSTQPSVNFASNSNIQGHYEISGNTVVLTQAGLDYIHSGNELGAITLIATDSENSSTQSETKTPISELTNDAPTISLALTDSINEESASENQVIATLSAQDEESTPIITFTNLTNTEGYYAISGNNVILTLDGAEFVNESGKLPEFGLTATDSENLSANSNLITPVIQSENDAPFIELTLGEDVLENQVSVNQVVASYMSQDEEDGSLNADFANNSNENNYYAIIGNDVVLTQNAVDFINSGNALPMITLSVTDSNSTTINSNSVTPKTMLIDRAPTITLTSLDRPIGGFVEVEHIVATIDAMDHEDTDLTFDFFENTNDSQYYELNGTQVVLTQVGADFVNMGGQLPQIKINVSDTQNNTTASLPVTADIQVTTDSDEDGILDIIEGKTDSDNDNIDDYLDTDSDNDGILDSDETVEDFDNDGIANYLDQDSDNDGLTDKLEGSIDSDEDGFANFLDLDSDNDGIADSIETNLLFIDEDMDGITDQLDIDFITGENITDDDNDGRIDQFTLPDTDSDGIADYIDIDSDNDGLTDQFESGLLDDTGTLIDEDEDGIADYFDVNSTLGMDLNLDGIDDSKTALDTDQDGIANYRDLDSDNDSLLDLNESTLTPIELDKDKNGLVDHDSEIKLIDNPIDSDLDGNADFIEIDSNNDEVFDLNDTEFSELDTNNTGSINSTTDIDQDGIMDEVDNQPNVFGSQAVDDPNPSPSLAPGIDTDNDGIQDDHEQYILPPLGVDTDSDSIDDRYDVDQTGGPDTNNDGIDDNFVANNDVDGDGTPNYLDLDSDGDGFLDEIENGDYNNDGISDFLQAEESLTTGVRGAGSLSSWFIFALLIFVISIRFKSIKYIALLLTILGISSQSYSQEKAIEPFSICQNQDSNIQSDATLNCVYAGLGAGFSLLYPNDEQSNWKVQSHASTLLNAQVGWRFSPRLFTEMNLHLLGNSKVEHINPNITDEQSIGYSALSLQVGGYLFDTKKEQDFKFNPFAKVGLAKLFTNASDDQVPVEQLNDFQLAISLGLQKQLNKYWFARVNWDGFDKDAKSVSVSIHRYIGSKVEVKHAEKPITAPTQPPEKKEIIQPELSKDYCKSVPDKIELDENGCPILYDTIVSIYFDFDSDLLNEDAKKIADTVVIFMKSNPDYIFEIQGNTDAKGSLEYNKALSLRRSENTLKYLVDQGIDKKRLKVIAYGESLAYDVNNKAYTQEQQRRADFVIIKED